MRTNEIHKRGRRAKKAHKQAEQEDAESNNVVCCHEAQGHVRHENMKVI